MYVQGEKYTKEHGMLNKIKFPNSDFSKCSSDKLKCFVVGQLEFMGPNWPCKLKLSGGKRQKNVTRATKLYEC